MVESDIVFPSSYSLTSFDHSTDTDSVAGSPSLQKPSSSTTRHHHQSRKRKLGRPVGSKNKPKPLLVIDKANKSVVKPVFIEVPESYDVIRTIVKFARHHQVSIIVLNASGTVSNVTIRNTHCHASPFTLYGPFKLISLTGTYIHNASLSSTLNKDPHCSFGISVSGIKEQSFIGGVGGKVVAQNVVMVTAVIVNKF
ncbi:AT-hook motif nuclear-localized protein 17-like [Vigna umbellata]|uniref:AT-hook motif nuclear-localized protein 17-like n=1 Tax=Vigna umbellata TaxID=87088 RepID=UPI001F5FE1D5|nr:AT-hook motif nuclear-localized protein 17-like [Vigna umbellata]